MGIYLLDEEIGRPFTQVLWYLILKVCALREGIAIATQIVGIALCQERMQHSPIQGI